MRNEKHLFLLNITLELNKIFIVSKFNFTDCTMTPQKKNVCTTLHFHLCKCECDMKKEDENLLSKYEK